MDEERNEGLLEFDQIHRLSGARERKILSIDEFFDGMRIDEPEKRDRKEFAKTLKKFLVNAINMAVILVVMKESVNAASEYIVNSAKPLIERFWEYDDYIDSCLRQFAEEFIRLVEEAEKSENPDGWWTSEERTIAAAENETATYSNHDLFNRYRRAGYTTKTWETVGDDRVRPSHNKVDGTTIPIDQPFTVGNSLMMHPRDRSMGADDGEIINCRCWLVFSKA